MSEHIKLFTTIAVDHDPFKGNDIVMLAPATVSQQAIFNTTLYADHARRAFNATVAISFSGVLDRLVMKQAIVELVKLHEVLHSGFSADGKRICIFRELLPDLFYRDISNLPEDGIKKYVAGYKTAEAYYAFNLVEGPLFKAGLIKTADQSYLLILTTHGLVCDKWSKGVIIQDLAMLYTSIAKKNRGDLAMAPAFSNYAFQQFRRAHGPVHEKAGKFWQQQLNGITRLAQVSADFTPGIRTFETGEITQVIDSCVAAKLSDIAEEAGCSFTVAVIALFELQLSIVTGHADFIIGLPVSDQPYKGKERLVGQCVRMLPLRSHIDGKINFKAYLKSRKACLAEAFANQEICFDDIKVNSEICSALKKGIMPVSINIGLEVNTDLDFCGVPHEIDFIPPAFSIEELSVTIHRNGVLKWRFQSQLFREETIRAITTSLDTLIEKACGNPFSSISFLSSASQGIAAGIHGRPNTSASDAADRTVTKLIALSTNANLHRTSIVFGETKMSFGELEIASNRFADYLLKSGIGKGAVVAMIADRSQYMIISILGILKCGAAFLPVSPEFPESRVQFMLEDSGAIMFATTSKYKNAFGSTLTREAAVDEILESDSSLSEYAPQISTTGEDLAYIIYTSGSTGKPKGVLVLHKSLYNYIQTCVVDYADRDDTASGSFVHLSLTFDASLTAVFVPLITGKAMVISTEKQAGVFNDPNLVKYAPYDFIKLTPAQFSLLEIARDPNAKLATRRFVVGGEALHRRHIAFLIEGNIDAEIINEYGPTEATVGSIYYTFNVKDVISEGSNGVSIGKPMPNVQVYILDAAMKPVETGGLGEIYIGGVQVAQGYLNRPELSAGKFIKNPFDGEDGLIYRTGDYAKYDVNGLIHYIGRIDEQVKIRGYRIEVGEIETRLSQLENVREAVVLAKEYLRGDFRLIAYVVPARNIANADIAGLVEKWRSSLRGLFPAYMIPSSFIICDTIPVTANGKTDKQQLLQLEEIKREGAAGYVEPGTAMEKLVAGIWIEYLGITRIGIHDHFFELGGHSLVAAQMMNRLEKETGRLLPLSILFEHDTIAGLAALLENDQHHVSWDSLVPIKPGGSKTPLYIVHGGGSNVLNFKPLVRHMDEDQPVFGLQAKGLNGIDEPLTTVEDMAAYYIEAITRNDSAGPYALAGYSFGGVIAFEMTRQIMAAGKEVSFLGIFDTDLKPVLLMNAVDGSAFTTLDIIISRILFNLKLGVVKPLVAFRNVAQWARIKWIHFSERLRYKKRERFEQLSTTDKMYMHNYHALSAYRIAPLDTRIELFRAKERNDFRYDVSTYGWRPFAKKGIDVYDIPGDHHHIFSAPNDYEFARLLQKVLDDNVAAYNG